MISNLSPSSQIFLADLSRLQARTNAAQRQISSGFKVESASDAPDQISRLLQLEANLSANTQSGTNLTNVKAEVDTGESAVSTAVQALEQAITLGAQGASSTVTASARLGLADQVLYLQQQLVGIAGTSVQGRYIFGGDADTQLPYQLDLANANGVDRLTNTPDTRQIQDASGNSFPVAETAQNIFDHRNPDDTFAPDNVFVALNSLRVALTNNDTPGIASALDALHTSSAYLNTQLSFYGRTQDRITAAVNDQQNRDVAIKAQISNIRDADLTAASLELTTGNTELQAALAGEAKISKNSLFSYLA
ncbi:MAG: flagellar hook-associated protein 3 [Bryobacterales bacterium]|nr:flagellar hook-associated protein 3 [Bryobacterales bacterium]